MTTESSNDADSSAAGRVPHELMTSQDVMAYLNVSRTKLWQLVKSQGLPAYKLGERGDYRYRRSEIEAWLKRQGLNQQPPANS